MLKMYIKAYTFFSINPKKINFNYFQVIFLFLTTQTLPFLSRIIIFLLFAEKKPQKKSAITADPFYLFIIVNFKIVFQILEQLVGIHIILNHNLQRLI